MEELVHRPLVSLHGEWAVFAGSSYISLCTDWRCRLNASGDLLGRVFAVDSDSLFISALV